MYEGFEKGIKSDIIVICNLNNYNVKDSSSYYNDWRMKRTKKDED